MTYEELVSEVQKCAAKIDVEKLTDHLAIQVNIEGEASGAFYIEVDRGNIVVAPWEYFDHDVLLVCQASQILAILKNELDPMQALSDGQIHAQRNIGRLGLLAEIIKKTPLKKAKKAEAEKKAKEEAAKKAEAEKKAKEEAAKKAEAEKKAKEEAAKKAEAEKKAKEEAAKKAEAEKKAKEETAKKTAIAKKGDEVKKEAEKAASVKRAKTPGKAVDKRAKKNKK